MKHNCSRNPQVCPWITQIPEWCRSLSACSSKIDKPKNMTTCRASLLVCDTDDLRRGKFSAPHAERSGVCINWSDGSDKQSADRCDSSTFGLVSSHVWHVSAAGLTAEWINGQMCVCVCESDHTETQSENSGDSCVKWEFDKARYL